MEDFGILMSRSCPTRPGPNKSRGAIGSYASRALQSDLILEAVPQGARGRGRWSGAWRDLGETPLNVRRRLCEHNMNGG